MLSRQGRAKGHEAGGGAARIWLGRGAGGLGARIHTHRWVRGSSLRRRRLRLRRGHPSIHRDEGERELEIPAGSPVAGIPPSAVTPSILHPAHERQQGTTSLSRAPGEPASLLPRVTAPARARHPGGFGRFGPCSLCTWI